MASGHHPYIMLGSTGAAVRGAPSAAGGKNTIGMVLMKHGTFVRGYRQAAGDA